MSDQKSWFASVNWFKVIVRVGGFLAFSAQSIILVVQQQNLTKLQQDLLAEQKARQRDFESLHELVDVQGEQLTAVNDLATLSSERLQVHSELFTLFRERFKTAEERMDLLGEHISLVGETERFHTKRLRAEMEVLRIDIGLIKTYTAFPSELQAAPPSPTPP